jgi:hypothetical protein
MKLVLTLQKYDEYINHANILGEIYQKSYRFRPFYVVLGRNLLKTG